jgi:hypothetical protein
VADFKVGRSLTNWGQDELAGAKHLIITTSHIAPLPWILSIVDRKRLHPWFWNLDDWIFII